MNASYEIFLDELKLALEKSDKNRVDQILQSLHSGWLNPKEVDALEEIISESTLFLELGDEDYRTTALRLIEELEQ